MENIYFIENADFNRWKDVVELTGKYEQWIFAEKDYHLWMAGFGPDNFNLLVAVDRGTEKTVGFIASGYYETIDESDPLVMGGIYFVLPEYRKSGLGLALCAKILSDPRFAKCNRGTIGVEAMRKKYVGYGLEKVVDYHFEETKIKMTDIDPKKLSKDSSVSTVSLDEVDFDKFILYDLKINGGIRRDKFIKKYLESNFSKIAVNENGKIIGFGNIRIAARNNLAIGPLYADSELIAETILKDILESIPNLNQYIYLYFWPPTANSNAKSLYHKLASSPDKIILNANLYIQFSKNTIQVDPSKVYSMTDDAFSYC